MPDELPPYVTQREFDQLVTRVENLDRDGTRGVLALQQQLSDTIKDLTEIKVDLSNFKKDTEVSFDKHLEQHQAERKERISSRRWAIGVSVAVLGAIGGMYAFLGVIFQHVH